MQRNVNALLDALAPERVLTRGDAAKMTVETHRTPTGCVLQGPGAALSVSWFADPNRSIGELHVVLWRGIVSRRGAGAQKEGATIVQELVLSPIDGASNDRVWRSGDGAEYDTASLAAHCLALLERQMAASP